MTHDALSNGQDPNEWATIADYVSGELSQEDRTRFEAQLTADPTLTAQVRNVREGLDALGPLTPAFDGDRVYDRIRHRLEASHSPRTRNERANASSRSIGSIHSNRSGHTRSAGVRVWGLACVLVLGMTAAWAVHTTQVSPKATAARTYVTRTGQQATVTLADASRIVLAPQTTLVVPDDFGAGHRTVTLSGEAFFTVRNAAGAPFIVQTGNITTRVLGTEFSVRRYAADDTVQVVVRSGRVVARGRTREIIVPANTIARVTDSTATSTHADRIYTDWTEGRLVFKDAKIADVLATVGRWYGYQFRLADSTLSTETATIAFKVSDPAEMMTALKSLLDVDMTFNGTLVTLTPSRNARTRPAAPIHTNGFKPQMEIGR